MSATRSRTSKYTLRPTIEQRRWIGARDRIAAVVDRGLAAKPPPRTRRALALVEQALHDGDRVLGL